MSKRGNELETFNTRDQCLNRTTTQLLKSKVQTGEKLFGD